MPHKIQCFVDVEAIQFISMYLCLIESPKIIFVDAMAFAISTLLAA